MPRKAIARLSNMTAKVMSKRSFTFSTSRFASVYSIGIPRISTAGKVIQREQAQDIS
jgi:hypothetical protein